MGDHLSQVFVLMIAHQHERSVHRCLPPEQIDLIAAIRYRQTRRRFVRAGEGLLQFRHNR